MSDSILLPAPMTGKLSEVELRHLIKLHRILYARPLALSNLLSLFGSAKAVFGDGTRSRLTQAGLTEPLVSEILANRSAHEAGYQNPHKIGYENSAERTLAWLDASNHYLIGLGDEEYPALLREITDPPPLLFAAGNLEPLAQIKFAIVGSRHPTRSGMRTAKDFASELAGLGMVIVSGMAKGIDTQAHKGALEGKGSTIAVLGTGCDLTYPPGQKVLEGQITEGGLLLSEFPLGTSALKHHFPQRNRIVTGLSTGTLVVEGALKSGSLISARLAMEQGREVFSIPGSIYSNQSRGCHDLIRNGAKLTESVGDILEELQGMVQFEQEIAGDKSGFEKQKGPPPTFDALDEKERKLLGFMDFEPIHLDELIARTGMRVQDVSSLLTVLEIKGLVKADVMGYSLAF